MRKTKSMRRQSLFGVVILSALLSPATLARADLAKATANFEKGTRLYQVGEYAKALEEFKAGFVEEADPSFLYNVAQCYRQLEQPKEALVSYRRFLSLAPDTPLRADVERKIRELEEDLRNPRAADTARAPGRSQSAPQAATGPDKWDGPQGHVEAKAETSSPSRWPVWVGGVMTLAFAGGATALGLSTNSRFTELRDTCGRKPAGCPTGDVETIRDRGRLVNVLWALAGASAVATGIGIYVTSREASVSVALKF